MVQDFASSIGADAGIQSEVTQTSFRKFTIDLQVPRLLDVHLIDVHLISDNYSTHKTTVIRHWLAKRPRFNKINLIECATNRF